jgi:hypothetical protein
MRRGYEKLVPVSRVTKQEGAMTEYVVRIGTDTRLLSLVRVLGDGKCNAVITINHRRALTSTSHLI